MVELLKLLSSRITDKKRKKKGPNHERFYSQGLTRTELRRMFRSEEP